MNTHRVEVFDCPQRGYQDFTDRESADKHRDWLVENKVDASNIRIVRIDENGVVAAL
jgi:hypothetical protein